MAKLEEVLSKLLREGKQLKVIVGGHPIYISDILDISDLADLIIKGETWEVVNEEELLDEDTEIKIDPIEVLANRIAYLERIHSEKLNPANTLWFCHAQGCMHYFIQAVSVEDAVKAYAGVLGLDLLQGKEITCILLQGSTKRSIVLTKE